MNFSLMLISLIILVIAFIPFALMFERKRPRAREVVIIAAMSSIAVVANLICGYTIPLHGGTAVVIITGIALGPEAGFLTGALARFVCNFFMGQGIWTPWEMAAWGLLGVLAGIFFYKPVLIGKFQDVKQIRKEQTRYGLRAVITPVAIIFFSELLGYLEYIIFKGEEESFLGWRLYVFGLLGIIVSVIIMKSKIKPDYITMTVFTFVVVFIVYGGIMNLAAMFMNSSVSPSGADISWGALKLLYISGVPYDALHALGASICVFLFGDSLIQKLERVRIKYGLYKVGKGSDPIKFL